LATANTSERLQAGSTFSTFLLLFNVLLILYQNSILKYKFWNFVEIWNQMILSHTYYVYFYVSKSKM
jgi:hypothetical protein